MEQSLFQELAKVDVARRVEDAISLASSRHQAGQTQLPKVLGHRRRPHPRQACEITYGQFTLKEKPQDPQASCLRQHPQGLHRHVDLFSARQLSTLRHYLLIRDTGARYR